MCNSIVDLGYHIAEIFSYMPSKHHCCMCSIFVTIDMESDGPMHLILRRYQAACFLL